MALKGGEAAVMEQRRLVKRALAGNRAALSELVQYLAPAIRARISVLLLRSGKHNQGDLEDLAQETLVALLVAERPALISWDPDLGMSLAGYAALVAERRTISWLRVRRAVPCDPSWLEQTSMTLELDGQVHARSTLTRLAHHLHETLSPQGLEMFYRLYTWEQSVEQAAEQTGSSIEAVYQWKSRLKKMALAFVAGLDEEKSRSNVSEFHAVERS